MWQQLKRAIVTAPLAALVIGTGLAGHAPPANAADSAGQASTGTGNTAHVGTVTFPTTKGSTTYSLRYPGQSNLNCQNYTSGKVYSGSDNLWGNRSRYDLETACADAFYAVDQERQMFASWLGRDGMDGQGGWVPIRMGLDEDDAYYSHNKAVVIGRERSGAWLSQIDAVAHEFGHAVDDHTPGGISDDTTAEFIADAFGAATEFYANNPVDTPDYIVGEEGDKPIRSMSDPRSLGAPNCYDKKTIASTETHDAAGPGNHWFYLLAEGSRPTDGQPTSPTCNGSTVTGAGIKTAIQVLYRAMLLKSSSTSYPKYRTWTLTAAKSMDASCGVYATVKAAWDAVSVPAQSGEPGCVASGSSACTGQVLGNPGFETGTAAPWTASEDVIDGSGDQAAHSGQWKAWLNGFGDGSTSELRQAVSIPTGCKATLSFYLHVGSEETSRTTGHDRLTVKIGSTTLHKFTNLDEKSGFQRYSFDVSAYAGKTVTITFTGKEDSKLPTSFVIDDTALTLG